MNESKFWELIDQARGGGGKPPSAPSADPGALQRELAKLPESELIAFGHMYGDLLCRLNKWSVWGAGYVLSGGMGDDSFHYFRSWLIGKGKLAVEIALANPDDLGPFAGSEDEFDNELLEYAALEVAEAAGWEPPLESFEGDPDGEPSGEAWDEDEVGDHFPKLVQVSKRLGNWE